MDNIPVPGRMAKLRSIAPGSLQIPFMLQPEGFRFDQSPVQGVSQVTVAGQEMAEGSLDRQLNRLVQLLKDRGEKLMPLEAMLMQNQQGRELLPPFTSLDENWPSTNFGRRTDPFSGTSAMHEGIDYMAPQGTSIRALAGGVVVYSDNHSQYGKIVEIDHDNDHCDTLCACFAIAGEDWPGGAARREDRRGRQQRKVNRQLLAL